MDLQKPLIALVVWVSIFIVTLLFLFICGMLTKKNLWSSIWTAIVIATASFALGLLFFAPPTW